MSTPCASPWPFDDDANLTDEEIAMLHQPSHGQTRTTVLGQPLPSEILAAVQMLQTMTMDIARRVGVLEHYAVGQTAGCDCADCGNQNFDATGWGD